MKRGWLKRWIGWLFSYRHKRLFRLRIRWRVAGLRLWLWWQHFSVIAALKVLPRPLLVIVFGLGVPLLSVILIDRHNPDLTSGLWQAIKTFTTAGKLEWHEAIQLLVLAIGLPAAFLLWAFRDYHVHQTLENQRKDVNLKEFQEIQMRAAGAMDEKLPFKARETLQIAALHQLRSFLRGDYGDSFRRPAWELLRARLLASAEVTGSQAVRDWMANWRQELAALRDVKPNDRSTAIAAKIKEMSECLAKVRFNVHPVARAEQTVLREDWHHLFRRDLPLFATCYDGIILPEGALLAGCNFSQASFIKAKLQRVHLEDANLTRAHLEGANLTGAYLEGAHIWDAHLEGANLEDAHLEGANLRSAHLEGAHLWDAHLEGANLRGAHLEGANLRDAHLEGADLSTIDPAILADIRGAWFDRKTRFAANWDDLSEDERAAARQPWLDRGAVMID